jgi:RHS repeat-associated protein
VYGFNGKEKDNEVKGEGNQIDYGMRVYDPRLGRFLSVDPLTKDYPWYTPYQYAGNNPIRFIDLDGLEPVEPSKKNLKKTEETLGDAMGNWFDYNPMLLRASKSSINAQPRMWWNHAHGFANNTGNRVFNNLKGVAGEAIAGNQIYNTFAKHIGTMDILMEGFNPLNDPEGGFEGVGGTWDYGMVAKFRHTNRTVDNETPVWNLPLFYVDGTYGRNSSFDLSTTKKFLFEIKTLDPSSGAGVLYLNIKKGFEQAITNATINSKGYSILVVDKQAYQTMYNGVTPEKKAIIDKLFGQLSQKNGGQGGLWLVDNLESRAKNLATTTYHEVKSNTTNESNCADEEPHR